MIVDSDRRFPRESPVCAYWLTRCEGFTVRSESRVLGVVASVAGDGPLGLAETLVVRSRYRQRLLYTEEVTAVVPARQLLITARRPAAPRARPVTAAAVRAGKVAVHMLVQLVAFLAPRVRAGGVTAGRLSLVLLGRLRREVFPRAARAASRTAVSVCATAAALLDEVERLTALDGQPQPEQPAGDRGEVPERVLQ